MIANDTEDALQFAYASIEKLRNEQAAKVANGSCTSFDCYKATTGRIKGYDDCLKIIGKSLQAIKTRG